MAALNQLLDRWLNVLDAKASTDRPDVLVDLGEIAASSWSWLTVNPTDHAEPPRMPQPNPRPPTADEAARLANAAFTLDPDWGTFVCWR